jgi:hypothetical protein
VGAPLNFRWLLTAAIIGIASMLAVIALTSQEEIIGLFVLISVCVVGYLLQARVAVAQA